MTSGGAGVSVPAAPGYTHSVLLLGGLSSGLRPVGSGSVPCLSLAWPKRCLQCATRSVSPTGVGNARTKVTSPVSSVSHWAEAKSTEDIAYLRFGGLG